MLKFCSTLSPKFSKERLGAAHLQCAVCLRDDPASSSDVSLCDGLAVTPDLARALRYATKLGMLPLLWKPTPTIGKQPLASHCDRCRSCARAYKPQEFVTQLVRESELASIRCQTSPPVAQSSVLHGSGGSFGRNCMHLVAGRVLSHEFMT
jgi:hypothetical protein